MYGQTDAQTHTHTHTPTHPTHTLPYIPTTHTSLSSGVTGEGAGGKEAKKKEGEGGNGEERKVEN